MKATILFAISGIFLFMAGGIGMAFDDRQSKLPDDLSYLSIDQLGKYVGEIQTRCEVVTGKIASISQQRQDHESGSDASNISDIGSVGSDLEDVNGAIASIDFDLERLRAEILKRLSELIKNESDPTRRNALRAQYLKYKNELLQYRREVNGLSEGYKREAQAAGAVLSAPRIILKDEPTGEMEKELD